MEKKRFIVFVVLLLLVALSNQITSFTSPASACCTNVNNPEDYCQSVTPEECCYGEACPPGAYDAELSCFDNSCMYFGCCVYLNNAFVCDDIKPGDRKECPGRFADFTSCDAIEDCMRGCVKWIGPVTDQIENAPYGVKLNKSAELEPLGYTVLWGPGLTCAQLSGNNQTGLIRGFLTDQATTQPISPTANPTITLFGFTVVPNQLGFFEILNVPIGNYQLKAYAKEYNPKTVDHIAVQPGDQLVLNITLTKNPDAATTIRGLVTDATTSSPLSLTTIYFPSGDSAVTDANGHYEIRVDNLENGTYDIQAVHKGYQIASRAESLTAGGLFEINFVLTKKPVLNDCGNGILEEGEQCEKGIQGVCGAGVPCKLTDCTCPSSCSTADGFCADFGYQCNAAGGKTIDVFSEDCRTAANSGFNNYVCCDRAIIGVQSCIDGSLPGQPTINFTQYTPGGEMCRCGPDLINGSNKGPNPDLYCCYENGNGTIQDFPCQIGGQLHGMILNSSGGGIGGATIEVIDSGERATSEEFPPGEYVIENIAPRSITVKITKSGYQPLTVPGVTIRSGEITQRNFVLVIDQCQEIKLYSFVALPIKGVPFVNLTWDTNCDQFIRQKNGYVLYRNKKAIGMVDKGKRNYIDSLDLEWGTNYTYHIDVIEAATGTVASFLETSIKTGNQFCENVNSTEEFCLNNYCFSNNCTNDLTDIVTHGTPLTIRTECDGNNNIILADGGHRNSNCTRLSPTSLCINPSYGITYCKEKDLCEELGIPPNAPSGNILGLYYHDTYGSLTCEKDSSQLAPLDKRYCYYDYWQFQKQPYSNDNKCISCRQEDFCYDYQSQSACQKDNCAYGSTYGGSCLWTDTYYSELGKGICYFEGYKGTEYCNLCDANNSVFTNVQCSPNVCNILGGCFAAQDNSSCLTCNATVSCETFSDPFSCTGSNNAIFGFTGEPQNKGIICGSSTSFQQSGDTCYLGRCTWQNNTCFKDGNADKLPDCPIGGECLTDFTAPLTSLKLRPPYINTKPTTLSFQVDDRDSITYYCLSDDICCPTDTINNGTLALPNIKYNFTNFEGYKTFMYYSEDAYHNPEEIHKEQIYFDTKPPTITITWNLSDHSTDTFASNLEIHRSASEHSFCKDEFTNADGIKISPMGAGYVETNKQSKAVITKLKDAVYKYTVICTDDYGNDAKKIIFIEIDRVKLITEKSPHLITTNNESLTYRIKTYQQNFYCFFKELEPIADSTFTPFNTVGSGIVDANGDYVYNYNREKARGLATGVYNFKISCFDKPQGQEVDTTNIIFTVDKTAPNTTLLVDTGSQGLIPYNSSDQYKNATFYLACSDLSLGPPPEFGCEGIAYCIQKNACVPTSYIPGNITSFTLNETTGIFQVCFRSKDLGGNTEQTQCTLIEIDRTPPTLIINQPVDGDATNLSTVSLTGSFSESHIQTLSVVIRNASFFQREKSIDVGEANTFATTIDLFTGQNTIKVVGYDKAGNRAEKTITVYLDRNKPSISEVKIQNQLGITLLMGNQSTPLEYGARFNFSLRVNDFNYTDRTEQKTDDISMVRQTIINEGNEQVANRVLNYTIQNIGNLTRATIYSVMDSTALEIGKYQISYEARDKFGYTAYSYQNFTVQDTTPPTFAIKFTNASADRILHYGDYLVEITLSEPLRIAPFLEYTFAKQHDSVEILSFSGTKAIGIIHINIEDTIYFKLDNVSATFSITGEDTHGLKGTTITEGKNFAIDTTGPAAPQIFSPSEIIQYASGSNYPVTGSTYQGEQGTWRPSSTVLVYANTQSNSIFDPGWSKVGTIISLDKGSSSVWDAKQNGYFSVVSTTTLRINDPTGSLFTAGKYLEFANDKRSNKGFYKIDRSTLISSTGVSKIFEVVVSPSFEKTPSTSQNIHLWNQQGPAGWFTYSLSLSAERINFYAVGVDEAGNTGDISKVYTLIRDTIAPTFSNEQPSATSISSNAKVNISILADGTGSDIINASMSLNVIPVPVLLKQQGNKILLSYLPSSNLTNGVYTLAVHAVDRAGNIADYSWQFEIDATVPQDPQIYPRGKTKETSPRISIIFKPTEIILLTAVNIIGQSIQESLLSHLIIDTPTSYHYDLPLVLSDGEYTVTVAAQKELQTGKYGNTGKWIQSFIVDTTPPIILNLPNSKTSSEYPAEVPFKTNEPAICRWDFSDRPFSALGYPIETSYNTSHTLIIGEYIRGIRTLFVRCEDEVHNAMQNSSVIALEIKYTALKAPEIYLPNTQTIYVNSTTYTIKGSTFGGNVDKWVSNINVLVFASIYGSLLSSFTDTYSTTSYGKDTGVLWDVASYGAFNTETSSIVVNDPDNIILTGQYLQFSDDIKEDQSYYHILTKQLVSEVAGKKFYRITLDTPLEGALSTAQNLLVYNHPAPAGYFTLSLPLQVGSNYFYAQAKDFFNIFGAATKTYLLIYDPLPPTISSLRPAPNTITAENHINLSFVADGTASNISRVIVLVNGNEVPVTLTYQADTSFIINYFKGSAWNDGVYTISAQVFDAAGNSQNASWSFTIDSRVPAQPAITPNGSSNNNKPKFIYAFDQLDDIFISSASYATGAFQQFIHDLLVKEKKETYTFQISTSLTDGQYTNNVKAKRRIGVGLFGIEGSWFADFFIDTHPPIIISYPTTVRPQTLPAVFSVITNEDALCKFDLQDIGYSQMHQQIDEVFQLSHEVTVSGLTSGVVDIYLRCIDRAGNVMLTSTKVTIQIGENTLPQCADGIDNDGDGKIDLADPGCRDAADTNEGDENPADLPECSDGVDNDGDLLIDYPADPGCYGAGDISEEVAEVLRQCNDGIDNDGDSLIDYPADPGCDDINDDFEQEPIIPQCSDGIDNDHDGKIDYPADPGCISPEDNDESQSTLLTECNDGIDNDGDSFIDYPADPGCQTTADTSEIDPPLDSECSDGVDNDLDGKIDWPNDPGCRDAADTNEGDENQTDLPECSDRVDNDNDGKIDFKTDGSGDPDCESAGDDQEAAIPACQDGKDNDGDGLIDMDDKGCISPTDTSEVDPPLYPECSDGVDNDGDLLIDYPADPGCYGAGDSSEESAEILTQCNDGIDNDHDGKIDWPYDPGCEDVTDDTEEEMIIPQCSDGVDNDGDLLIDYPADPGCISPEDNDESQSTLLTECNDGVDNDANGRTDYPADSGCSSLQDTTESKYCPECGDKVDNDGDGTIDLADSACVSASNVERGNLNTECSDGRDNENDGMCDYLGCVVEHLSLPPDPGCYGSADTNEGHPLPVYGCSDQKDNDGDSLIDYPNDPDCRSLQDNDESTSQSLPQCFDGVDNDLDGKIDWPIDPGCLNYEDNEESSAAGVCKDGLDNDGDGFADWPMDPGCDGSGGQTEVNPTSPRQCSDNLDNDGDGYCDLAGCVINEQFYPRDLGCISLYDNDESSEGAIALCQDQYDNDGDGLKDLDDVGCSNSTDTNESDSFTSTECNNGIDDEGDGKIDWPIDPGCEDFLDTTESGTSSAVACADGIDNDLDNLIDWPFDPGCDSLSDTEEEEQCTIPQCDDGVDNDLDGKIDWPNDPGCRDAADTNEGDENQTDLPECSDRVDNDNDGKIDFKTDSSGDPDCESAGDDQETAIPACQDGKDNDGDGLIDMDDTGCSSPIDNSETDPPVHTECSDGIDNDLDGKIDLADPGCEDAADINEGDEDPNHPPICSDGIDNDHDGKIDYPLDPGCFGGGDQTEEDLPACNDGIDNDGDGLTDWPYDPGCVDVLDGDEYNAIGPSPTLPVLFVDQPLPEDSTATGKITVEGRVKNANTIKVYVNGRFKKTLQISLTHEYQDFEIRDVALVERESRGTGANDVMVVGINEEGNFTVLVSPVYYDDTGPIITLISPVDGRTGSTQPTIVVSTNEDATCSVRYKPGAQPEVVDSLDTTDYRTHSVTFSSELPEDKSTYIYVTCVDDYLHSETKRFTINVQTTKTIILDAQLYSAVLKRSSKNKKEYVLFSDATSHLDVTVNSSSLCKYGVNTTDYNFMQPFPGYAERQYSQVHSSADITFQDQGYYEVSIMCEDQGGILSEPYLVTVSVDLHLPIQITNLRPQNYTNQKTPIITLQTFRQAECTITSYNQGGVLAYVLDAVQTIFVDKGVMERKKVGALYNYSISVSSVSNSLKQLTENKMYAFNVYCKSQVANVNDSQMNFSFLTDFTLQAPVIYSPPDKYITNNSDILVIGYSEPGSTVELYVGEELQASTTTETGNFSFEALLLGGVNILSVNNYDKAGNANFTTRAVVFSAQGPIVLATSPSNGEVLTTVSKIIVVFGTDIGIDTSATRVELYDISTAETKVEGTKTINGTTVELRFENPLPDGVYSIFALPVDILNRSGEGKRIVFQVDHTAATIVLTSPYTVRPYFGYTTANVTIVFSGYISSANGALQNRLIIGSTTRSFTNTTFSFTETFNRKNAQHTFMITSKNELGVEGVIKGDITIDVEGPVATIIIN